MLFASRLGFASVYSDPRLYENVTEAAKNASVAAAGVSQLTRDLSGLTKQISALSNQTATQLGATTEQIRLTTGQVNRLVTNLNSLVTTNRLLTTALNNITKTSEQLRYSERPDTHAQPDQSGELVQNLETLSANAAQASANTISLMPSPTNLLVLQQTLDSARVTFQNMITSDLDELTGDPAFRMKIFVN